MPEQIINIKEIFRDIPVFEIPIYQRDFSWDNAQINQFWLDLDSIEIISNEPSHNHFLGLFVVVQQQGNHFYVIDGQQRITSVILLCIAMRDLISDTMRKRATIDVEKEQLFNLKRYFQNYIIEEIEPEGERKPKLIPNNNDKMIYSIISEEISNNGQLDEELNAVNYKKEQIINKFNKRILNSSKLFKAYKFFYTAVSDEFKENEEVENIINRLKSLYAKFSKGLTVIKFFTKDENDAYIVFETLNDRGLNLSALDLIKNKMLQKSNPANVETNNEIWNDIFSRNGSILQNKRTQEFLRTLWNSRDKFISNSGIYIAYKSVLSECNYDDTEKFLIDLKSNAENFRDITSIYRSISTETTHYISNNEFKEQLILLKKSKVRQWVTITLALYNKFKGGMITIEELIDINRLLLNICLRFKILDRRFNLIEKEFPTLANCISKQEVYSTGDNNRKIFSKVDTMNDVLTFVKDKLRSIIQNEVNNDRLKEIFNENYLFEDNDLAYLVLRDLGFKNLGYAQVFDTEESLTLEHILPEKHKNNWGDHQDADDIKYLIGNMLLLKSTDNSSINNKNFDNKKAKYIEKGVIENINDDSLSYSKVQNQQDWNLELVKQRSKNIIGQYLEVLSNY